MPFSVFILLFDVPFLLELFLPFLFFLSFLFSRCRKFLHFPQNSSASPSFHVSFPHISLKLFPHSTIFCAHLPLIHLSCVTHFYLHHENLPACEPTTTTNTHHFYPPIHHLYVLLHYLDSPPSLLPLPPPPPRSTLSSSPTTPPQRL